MEPTPINRRQALGVLVAGSCAAALARSENEGAFAAEAPRQKPIIWDTHCHLSGEGRTPEDKVANLLRYADRLGIDRMMIHMGYPIVVDPPPADIRRQNDQALKAIKYPDRTSASHLSGHYPNSAWEPIAAVKNGPCRRQTCRAGCSAPELS